MATKASSMKDGDVFPEGLKGLIDLLREKNVRHFKRGDLEIVFEAARPVVRLNPNAPGIHRVDMLDSTV
jgi:hypothetical protein